MFKNLFKRKNNGFRFWRARGVSLFDDGYDMVEFEIEFKEPVENEWDARYIIMSWPDPVINGRVVYRDSIYVYRHSGKPKFKFMVNRDK